LFAGYLCLQIMRELNLSKWWWQYLWCFSISDGKTISPVQSVLSIMWYLITEVMDMIIILLSYPLLHWTSLYYQVNALKRLQLPKHEFNNEEVYLCGGNALQLILRFNNSADTNDSSRWSYDLISLILLS
jgi:hypothetical protein